MVTDHVFSFVAPGDGESILIMTDLVTVKARSENKDNPFVLTEVSTPPQGGPPMMHRHLDQETFYVLEGLFSFVSMQDGQLKEFEAVPGAVIHIAGMAWHNYKNTGSIQGKLMVLLQPGNMLDFFREIGIPVVDKTNLPRLSGPPDQNRLSTAMRKHSVEVLEITLKEKE